jgi:hypothetical protein
MLVDEIVGRDGAFRGLPDAAEVFRRGETGSMPIVMDDLLPLQTSAFGEFYRGQTVDTEIGV